MDVKNNGSFDGHMMFSDRRQKSVPVDVNRRLVDRRAIPFKPDQVFHISFMRLELFIRNIAKNTPFVIKPKDELPACAVIKLKDKGEEIEKTFTFI